MRADKLLTRKEIIELWSKQPENILNSYCCPSCRDIMEETEDAYICRNTGCKLEGCNYPKNSRFSQ